MNFMGLFLIVGLCFLTGLVILAKYHDCNPLAAQVTDLQFKWNCWLIIEFQMVDKSDQLVPHFVRETIEGVPGLFKKNL